MVAANCWWMVGQPVLCIGKLQPKGCQDWLVSVHPFLIASHEMDDGFAYLRRKAEGQARTRLRWTVRSVSHEVEAACRGELEHGGGARPAKRLIPQY